MSSVGSEIWGARGLDLLFPLATLLRQNNEQRLSLALLIILHLKWINIYIKSRVLLIYCIPKIYEILALLLLRKGIYYPL